MKHEKYPQFPHLSRKWPLVSLWLCSLNIFSLSLRTFSFPREPRDTQVTWCFFLLPILQQCFASFSHNKTQVFIMAHMVLPDMTPVQLQFHLPLLLSSSQTGRLAPGQAQSGLRAFARAVPAVWMVFPLVSIWLAQSPTSGLYSKVAYSRSLSKAPYIK